MKLIDADAFKRDLDTMNPMYERMIRWCKKMIDLQPAIIDIKMPIQVIEYGGGKNGNKSNN